MQKIVADNFVASGANIYNIYAKCYKPVYPPHLEDIGEEF